MTTAPPSQEIVIKSWKEYKNAENQSISQSIAHLSGQIFDRISKFVIVHVDSAQNMTEMMSIQEIGIILMYLLGYKYRLVTWSKSIKIKLYEEFDHVPTGIDIPIDTYIYICSQ
jgi:hypothetical protein